MLWGWVGEDAVTSYMWLLKPRVGMLSWCSVYGEVWRFLQKLKTEQSYDPAVPLLGL